MSELTTKPKLMIIGCGYTGLALARIWEGEVTGTTRNRREALKAAGVTALSLDNLGLARLTIERASAIILSAPPPDPALPFARIIANSKAWLGYLSTTAVYGDHQGAWVDEATPPTPTSERGALRLETENYWQSIAPRMNIFRLSGIYGAGRGPFEKLAQGHAQNIIKEGQVFGRIHVDDVARILRASFEARDHGEIYNLTDNEPAPPQDVMNYAAKLQGLPPLPEVDFNEADLKPMARSFYEENKRVSNAKIRARFGELLYPDYRIGLDAIFAQN